ncbi:hypothetical protein Dimus_027694 [Dionaea muscipula]
METVPDFLVEELLNLPNGDEMMMMMADTDADAFLDSIHHGNSTDSSTATAVDSCNSSVSGGETNNFAASADGFPSRTTTDAQFSGTELCVPYDDVAELEWLSNFVEESFSTEDLHKFQLVSGPPNGPIPGQFHNHHQSDTTRSNPIFNSKTLVPGKARSKLSRIAPSDWSTRLLMVSPTTLSTESHVVVGVPPKRPSKRREAIEDPNGEVRRCLHCASEKTPQWRTGPLGPKTLCNACGVRYKSGRLVPEYRPAASPTFVSAKHSNSHRKVMELRRQKELQLQHQQQQFMSHGGIFGMSNGADDYLIRHHLGTDYRQLNQLI